MSDYPAPVFYKIDSSRFSFREYFWGSKNPLILVIAAIIKGCRINTGGSTDDPPVESLAPFEVAESDLPEEIRNKFAPLAGELAALGFVEPIFHFIDDRLNFATYYWATFHHQSGHALARIHCRIWKKTHPPRVHLFPYFISFFSDETFLYTSSGKPDTELPSSVKALRLRGKPTAELWAQHESEVRKSGKMVGAIRNTDELRVAAETFHSATRDFNLKRKAFKPLGADDQKTADLINSAKAEATARGSANADVLAELAILQRGTTNWKNSIWLLVITGIAFVLGSRAQTSSLQTTALLIPILLFHELGHYLAMYVFKYRNLRMFFIPFFGAAVTGQNYTVAAWKKVVVFLLGPLPGIALGCVLMPLAIYKQNDLLFEAASLCIIVNAFNLLPLLPFDGGRVVGTILFSRHYILDTVFRLLTALGVLIMAYAMGSKVLIYVGLMSLLAVRTSFKLAKATEEVRNSNLPMLSADGETMPHDTAEAVVTAVKQKFPKGLTTKQVAQHALTVFETLNSRPPGWVASIFFLGVHGLAFVVAVAAVIAGMVYHNGGRGLLAGASLARHPIDSKSISIKGAKVGALNPTNSIAVVATYRKPDKAAENFGKISPQLPPNGTAMLFGSTIYVRLPRGDEAARRTIFSKLSTTTSNIFVERTNYLANFAFSIQTPAGKAETFREFEDFWDLPSPHHAMPPWAPHEAVTNWTELQLARHTYRLLTRGDEEPSSKVDDEEEKDRKAINVALRTGDTGVVDELREKSKKRREQERAQKLAKIKAMPDTAVHRRVIETYMEYPTDTNSLPTYRAAQTNLVSMMGPLPADLQSYGIRFGFMYRNGDAITVQSVKFNDVLTGAPAFVEWLEKAGAQKIRYGVNGISYSGDEREEGDEE